MTIDKFFIKLAPMLCFLFSPLEKLFGGFGIIFAILVNDKRRRNTENKLFRFGMYGQMVTALLHPNRC